MMKLCWTILTVLVALISPALAGDEMQRATLKGPRGVYVLVEKVDAERDGLAQSALRTDVELQVRQAGIRVLTKEESSATPGGSYLYLNVNTRKGTGVLAGLYAFSIDLELKQKVLLARNPSIAAFGITTWSATRGVGMVGVENLSNVRETVQGYVDEVIKAYLAANPKR